MRRVTLSFLALSIACGTKDPPKAPAPDAPKTHLSPVEDLVPAAGLSWLVLARPREIAAHADMIVALHYFVSEERLNRFAVANGGVDLRSIDELAIAKYPDTTLYLARTHLDPARVESAFATHLGSIEGRVIDRKGGRDEQIVRAWGQASDGREQLAIFGIDAVGLEQGKFGPLRAAELFADRRLKRASPALRAAPLSRAATLIKDAPLRAFAAGPFEGEWSKGFAGLLAATTAVGIAVRLPTPTPTPMPNPTPTPTPTSVPLSFTLTLLGAWGADASAASERLLAVYGTLSSNPLGHLCGLDRPLTPPRARTEPDALILDVTLDALALARGLHLALDAQVDEIMRYGAPRAPQPLTPVP